MLIETYQSNVHQKYSSKVTSQLRSWDYLTGDLISAVAKQVSHNNISKATKDPVNPVNQSHGASHNDMTLQCYWGWGLRLSQMGCLIYKSFLCESITNQGSRGEKRSPLNYACVFGGSIQSRNTRPNTHWLTPLWKNTPEGLNYSGTEPQNSGISEISAVICSAKLQQQARIEPLSLVKTCPSDCTEKRLSRRRLYSTFVASCENKAI